MIPKALTVLNADPRRVATGGISMGGIGASALARLEPGRFCAVGGHFATIYPTYGEADTGAFDNANSFPRNDVLAAAKANPKLYGHAQLRLDDSSQDYLHDGDEQLASALHIPMHTWPGAHDFTYWNAEQLPGLLRPSVRHLRVGVPRTTRPTSSASTRATGIAGVSPQPAASLLLARSGVLATLKRAEADRPFSRRDHSPVAR